MRENQGNCYKYFEFKIIQICSVGKNCWTLCFSNCHNLSWSNFTYAICFQNFWITMDLDDLMAIQFISDQENAEAQLMHNKCIVKHFLVFFSLKIQNYIKNVTQTHHLCKL